MKKKTSSADHAIDAAIHTLASHTRGSADSHSTTIAADPHSVTWTTTTSPYANDPLTYTGTWPTSHHSSEDKYDDLVRRISALERAFNLKTLDDLDNRISSLELTVFKLSELFEEYYTIKKGLMTDVRDTDK